MYCKINYLKSLFKFLGLQAICGFGCTLLIMMFPGLISFRFGEILYSFVALIIAFDLLFSTAWTIGSRHRRDINIHNKHLADGEQPLNYSYKSGAMLGALYALFGLIICIICLIMSKSSTPGVSVAGNFIFKLWFIEYFVAFKYIVRMNDLLCIILSLTPFVPIFTGFVCGIKDVNYVDSFMNKIVYKNNK